MTHQALCDVGVQSFKDVPVKQMNNVGPILALMPLSSFTAFGVWFDEKQLTKYSPSERIFAIYHEAAHYAHQHHQKLLAIGSAATASAIIILVYLHKKLVKEKIQYAAGITAGTGVLMSLAIYFGLLPRIVREQEKEADITAAKTLVRLGKKDVVDQHIQRLEQDAKSNQSNIWWYSEQAQQDYLKELLNALRTTRVRSNA